MKALYETLLTLDLRSEILCVEARVSNLSMNCTSDGIVNLEKLEGLTLEPLLQATSAWKRSRAFLRASSAREEYELPTVSIMWPVTCC